MSSTTVAHYLILEKLGGGGMGVVYKADDIRLRRLAALKFLPEAAAHDSQAAERFEREARVASALNHRASCTIHELDDQDGQRLIVMEHLDGETLEHRIASNVVVSESVLSVCRQFMDSRRRQYLHQPMGWE